MKWISIVLLFTLSFLVVNAQQHKRKKKKRVVNKNVTALLQQKRPLTESDKTHLNNGFFKATVVDKRGLDGCRFLLKMEDGSLLAPSILNDSLQVAGKKIWIKFSVNKTTMSVCMSGTPVTITAQEALKE